MKWFILLGLLLIGIGVAIGGCAQHYGGPGMPAMSPSTYGGDCAANPYPRPFMCQQFGG